MAPSQTYPTQDASALPYSRLRLTMPQMATDSRCASVHSAGCTTLLRTSSVATDTGSLIKGRSMSSSISRLLSSDHVRSSRFLFCRMRRPLDADMTEVVETDVDGAVAAIERRVHIRAHARDSRSVNGIGGAG